MEQTSLRRLKLRWCAEHNLAMRKFRSMPVQYLLNHMPDFLQASFQDRQRAQDKLEQYLSSKKATYWQNRPNFVAELCKALQLSLATWNSQDFTHFKTAATTDYQKHGLWANPSTMSEAHMDVNYLRGLPTTDGTTAITLDVERRGLGIAFRRTTRHPISQRFYGDERVRIRFRPPEPGYGLLFLLDPAENCQMLAPTIYQVDTQLHQGVLHVPNLHEPAFSVPEKIGRHSLYAMVTPDQVKGDIAKTDGNAHLTKESLGRLIGICERCIESGGTLFRVDLMVHPDT